MAPQRPLPDSREREEDERQERLLRWALAVIGLLVLVGVALLLLGR